MSLFVISLSFARHIVYGGENQFLFCGNNIEFRQCPPARTMRMRISCALSEGRFCSKRENYRIEYVEWNRIAKTRIELQTRYYFLDILLTHGFYSLTRI